MSRVLKNLEPEPYLNKTFLKKKKKFLDLSRQRTYGAKEFIFIFSPFFVNFLTS